MPETDPHMPALWCAVEALIPDDSPAEDQMAFIDHHTPIWTPADVIRYADAVRRGIGGDD